MVIDWDWAIGHMYILFGIFKLNSNCHVLILLIKKGETTFKSMKRVKITVHERTFNVKSKWRMTF